MMASVAAVNALQATMSVGESLKEFMPGEPGDLCSHIMVLIKHSLYFEIIQELCLSPSLFPRSLSLLLCLMDRNNQLTLMNYTLNRENFAWKNLFFVVHNLSEFSGIN